MGLGFLFLHSSLTKDAIVSLKDPMDYCWGCIVADCSYGTHAYFASCRAISSDVLAVCELTPLPLEEDED